MFRRASHSLVALISFTLFATTGCASAPETALSQAGPAPGQAPVSLASPDMHQKWGAAPEATIPTPPRPAAEDAVEPVREHTRTKDPTRDMLAAGFQNIRRSTDQCLARYLKRNGEVPTSRLHLQLTIRGDGKVARMTMDRELSGTVFGTCLRSHMDRWHFDAWGGEPIKVARIFILE